MRRIYKILLGKIVIHYLRVRLDAFVLMNLESRLKTFLIKNHVMSLIRQFEFVLHPFFTLQTNIRHINCHLDKEPNSKEPINTYSDPSKKLETSSSVLDLQYMSSVYLTILRHRSSLKPARSFQ